MGKRFLTAQDYIQMKGRAGRKGQEKGESILMCKTTEKHKVLQLLKTKCAPLESCLADSQQAMNRALLEVIANDIVKNTADLDCYLQSTLLYHQSRENATIAIEKSLEFLSTNDFISIQKSGDITNFNRNELSIATMSSGLR